MNCAECGIYRLDVDEIDDATDTRNALANGDDVAADEEDLQDRYGLSARAAQCVLRCLHARYIDESCSVVAQTVPAHSNN